MNFEPGIEIISATCPKCHQVYVYLGTRWHQLQCKSCRQPFDPPLTIAEYTLRPAAFRPKLRMAV